MKRSGDSTHSCRSPTQTVNGCDLTRLIRKKNSEQECSGLTAIKMQPPTRCSRNTPHSFSRGTRSYAFSRSTKHVYIRLWHTSRISQNLLVSEILVYNSTAATKTALGIIQLWFSYFVASFYRALGIYFSMEAKRRYTPVVVHSLLSLLLCMGMITPLCQFFGALPEHQAIWHTRARQRTTPRC